jgi:hypothetical protein
VLALSSQVTAVPQGALVLAAGEEGLFWSSNRGVAWNKQPPAPRPGQDIVGASDASTMLGAVPLRVVRYGTGSARVSLPFAER